MAKSSVGVIFVTKKELLEIATECFKIGYHSDYDNKKQNLEKLNKVIDKRFENFRREN